MQTWGRRFRLPIIFLPALLLAQGPPPGGAGDGVWRRNAFYGEIQTFDACVGHQPQTGEYHYHVNPLCLRAQLNDNVTVVRTARTGPVYRENAAPWKHSPILGWAIDGYPIYGPYGYSDPADPASAVKRIKSSFRLRGITARTSLPDWALPNHAGISQQLPTTRYGPDISVTAPLGRYLEDFEFAAGLGDLDVYNGRFSITPDYPQGIYAYYVVIDDTGAPAFPYILAGQYYGTPSGGRAPTVGSDAADYFNAGVTSPAAIATAQLTSWATKNSGAHAHAVSGYDPSSGPSETWPTNTPSRAAYNGGVATPTNGDTQRIRYNNSSIYINANGLATYTMGPWFDPGMAGGVFQNFPANQNYQFQFPRSPVTPAARTSTGGGPIGLWVNGVAVFNFIDGASYSNASRADQGGGGVTPTAVQLSAASYEAGPQAAGSIVAAFPLFGASLAATTATAPTPDWPVTLGGATVTVKDSAGASRSAAIYYASPTQVNYRIPADSALGFGTVTISANGNSYNANLNITASYPNLFLSGADGQGAGVVTFTGTQEFLVLFGSGLGNIATATATIGGVNATVTYAGPQGTYQGLDQYNILLPSGVSGKADVVITAAGRASNPVYVLLP